jgi:hypothetical protein
VLRRRRGAGKVADAADAALSFGRHDSDDSEAARARPGSPATERGVAWEDEEGEVMAAHGVGETGAAVDGPGARGLQRVWRARARLETPRALMGRFEEAAADRPPCGSTSPLGATADDDGGVAAGGEEEGRGVGVGFRRSGKALPTLVLPPPPLPQTDPTGGGLSTPPDRLETERLNSPLARRLGGPEPRLTLARAPVLRARAWGGDPAEATAGSGAGAWDGEQSESVVPL